MDFIKWKTFRNLRSTQSASTTDATVSLLRGTREGPPVTMHSWRLTPTAVPGKDISMMLKIIIDETTCVFGNAKTLTAHIIALPYWISPQKFPRELWQCCLKIIYHFIQRNFHENCDNAVCDTEGHCHHEPKAWAKLIWRNICTKAKFHHIAGWKSFQVLKAWAKHCKRLWLQIWHLAIASRRRNKKTFPLGVCAGPSHHLTCALL